MYFEEKTTDQQRSIRLVEIMNAMGFSKCERQIQRHFAHLRTALNNIFENTDTCTSAIAGSTSEGMCGGIYSDKSHHDYDFLLTYSHIKLYTPRTNSINNPPLFPLPLHDNEDCDASCFVEEDDNFPGYVKLPLAEVKINCAYLKNC